MSPRADRQSWDAAGRGTEGHRRVVRGPEGQDYLRTEQVSVAGRECSLNWTSSRGVATATSWAKSAGGSPLLHSAELRKASHF